MALQPGAHPARIKDAVTSEYTPRFTMTAINRSVTAPGGCTIAGLLVLEDGRVRSTIARAIQIATERASELGQPSKR
jgi:pyrroline-5-carboxylate reductase